MTPTELLGAASVLLIDWPGREVPDALALAGCTVSASEGPDPTDYATYTVRDGEVVRTPTDRPPAQVDVVYSHRPDDELPDIVRQARELGARAVWCETPSDDARRIVESAGLEYVDEPRIVDAARSLVRPSP